MPEHRIVIHYTNGATREVIINANDAYNAKVIVECMLPDAEKEIVAYFDIFTVNIYQAHL
jgi:hypothetical protein